MGNSDNQKQEKTCQEKENSRLPDKKRVLNRNGKKHLVENVCEEIYEYAEKDAVHAD